MFYCFPNTEIDSAEIDSADEIFALTIFIMPGALVQMLAY
jgi:hypothetical protein